MAKKRKLSDGRPGLSREDALLWSRVAGTVKPLPERQSPSPEALITGRKEASPEVEPAARHSSPAAEEWAQAGEPPARRAAPPPLAHIDRRETRQIAGGRLAVDARIDLHGHRQREAYGALKAFLTRARAAGHRYVLVITGKGAVRADDDAAPFYETREAGVLKRAVPRWLAEPGFRELIVSYGPAHARHGGEGALYIRLRRERGG